MQDGIESRKTNDFVSRIRKVTTKDNSRNIKKRWDIQVQFNSMASIPGERVSNQRKLFWTLEKDLLC